MTEKELKYLECSLKKLEKWLPETLPEMIAGYTDGSLFYNVEEDEKGYVYCQFSWPETEKAERLVLLVFDDAMRVIADISGIHCRMDDLMKDTDIYDLCSEESDWMYLEHYILCQWGKEELPYPYCEADAKEELVFDGEALLISNAYVTESFRRQGIFTMMEMMMREASLRNVSGAQILSCAISLDPDIACYGPDAKDEPYYYNYETDEPRRMKNAEIAEKRGYEVIRLQEDDPRPDSDGTKIWFAVRYEQDLIIDQDQAS